MFPSDIFQKYEYDMYTVCSFSEIAPYDLFFNLVLPFASLRPVGRLRFLVIFLGRQNCFIQVLSHWPYDLAEAGPSSPGLYGWKASISYSDSCWIPRTEDSNRLISQNIQKLALACWTAPNIAGSVSKTSWVWKKGVYQLGAWKGVWKRDTIQ